MCMPMAINVAKAINPSPWNNLLFFNPFLRGTNDLRRFGFWLADLFIVLFLSSNLDSGL